MFEWTLPKPPVTMKRDMSYEDRMKFISAMAKYGFKELSKGVVMLDPNEKIPVVYTHLPGYLCSRWKGFDKAWQQVTGGNRSMEGYLGDQFDIDTDIADFFVCSVARDKLNTYMRTNGYITCAYLKEVLDAAVLDLKNSLD